MKLTSKKTRLLFALLLSSASLASCQQPSVPEKTQLQIRQEQSQTFPQTKKDTMMQSVIATLQDLGFILDRVNNDLGVIGATKLDRAPMHATVTVRPWGTNQTRVRISLAMSHQPVTDTKSYRAFFTTLTKSLASANILP